jgi:hypothetical protein
VFGTTMKKQRKTVYRFFDDHEEKHYVLCELEHKELEVLVDKFKAKREKIFHADFFRYLRRYDKTAEEVIVKDFYF